MAAKDQGYDPDAFDSMAVVNAEQWNKSGPDGEQLTRADILPHVNAQTTSKLAS